MTDNVLAGLRLHLVGCGKMGSALLKGWLQAGIPPENISAKVATQESAVQISRQFAIHCTTDQPYQNEDVVIFAVKPQMLPALLAEQWQDAPASPLYISIAAGIRLESLHEALGEKARIIRAMPNTPVLVGKGVTSLCAGDFVGAPDKAQTEALFSAVGEALWMETERKLNAATAIAGSGPAYVFYFAECLQEIARDLELPDDVAKTLMNQTLRGSIALADAEGWDVKQLRQNVASKGGVTEAALKRLADEESGLKELMHSAIMANLRRTRELG